MFTVFNNESRSIASARMGGFGRARFVGAGESGTNGSEMLRGYFFGAIEYTLAASLIGVGVLSATLTAGGWQKTPFGWSNASGGADRQMVTLVPTYNNASVKLQLADRDGDVHILIRTSEDGRDAFECGVFNVAGTYYATIRKVTDGTVAAAGVTNGANDTPASVECRSDVTALVVAASTFVIEARFTGTAIEFRLNNETAARLVHTPGAVWENHNAVGFASLVNSARVIDAQLASLVGQTSSAQDVLVAVCDGSVWASREDTFGRVSSGYFPTTGLVQMAPFGSKMLMLGPIVSGLAKAAKFDPVTLSVTPWTPTAGKLPGQVGVGTTTAQVLTVAGTRDGLAGQVGDEQNAQFGAVADENDQDTGSELPGSAFTLGGTRPLKRGEPITCLQQATNSVLIVGCVNSIQVVQGDPALGAFDTGTLSEYNGITGPQSMVLVEEGRVIGHSDNGLFAIPPIGTATNISEGVLQEGLNVTREEREANTIILARDPERGWLHIFRTPNDGSDGLHLIYDEKMGGFIPSRPAYFPQRYPAAMQPTCAAVWKGRLYLGCRDGYIRYFDDAVYNDDGQAIDAFAVGELIDSTSIGDDATVNNIRVQMTRASGALQVRVYGADSADNVYDPDERTTLLNETRTTRDKTPITCEVRSAALVVEIRNATLDQTIVIEGITADVKVGLTRS